MKNFLFKSTTRSRISYTCILLVLGFIYYIFTQLFDFYIPCIFHEITGFDCPACGITTASIAIIHRDFYVASTINLGLTLSLPILAPTLIYAWYLWITDQPSKNKFLNIIYIFLIIYFILWGIIRNLPFLSI